jgi:hypothetical protein
MTFEGVLGLEEVVLPTLTGFPLLDADAAKFVNGDMGLRRASSDESTGLSDSVD